MRIPYPVIIRRLALVRRLEAILGKPLNQSDVDFLKVLARDDVREYVLDYLAESESQQ